MQAYETVWLYAENDNPNGDAKATYLVDDLPPGANVLATIALSYFTEGVSYDQGAVGAAGAVIRQYQTRNPDGSVTEHDNTDFALNSVFVENCASLTFELAVNFARAYAQASVFLL